MCATAGVPWNRYGMIAELAERLSPEFPRFGKTSLQKCIYLLQDALDVPCGYQYKFYTYGPYSSQLSQDLGFVELTKGVNIHMASGAGGFVIEKGEEGDFLKNNALDFLSQEKFQTAVNKLIEDFKGSSAKDMELRSTIVFTEKDLKRKKQEATAEIITSTVSQLKPKFSKMEINKAVIEMNDKRYITLLHN